MLVAVHKREVAIEIKRDRRGEMPALIRATIRLTTTSGGQS